MVASTPEAIKPVTHQNNPGKELPVDVIVMSSSLLTDRMFLYTRFLEELNHSRSVKVWASSALNPSLEQVWQSAHVPVEGLPAVRPFKEFPYNYLRRLNEFVWDFRH